MKLQSEGLLYKWSLDLLFTSHPQLLWPHRSEQSRHWACDGPGVLNLASGLDASRAFMQLQLVLPDPETSLTQINKEQNKGSFRVTDQEIVQ